MILSSSAAMRSGTLPPVSLRYIDSSCRLCPIHSTVHPTVQIVETISQSGFLLLPCHTIDSRGCLTLECVEAVTEKFDVQMVEQSGESFLLPFSCCLPHTAQSLGQAFPA